MGKRIDPQLEQLGLGRKIRGLRQQRRYTLQTMANRTGLSKPLLSQVENARVTPPLTTLLKIAKALGVEIGHFFQADEPEEKVALTRASERRQGQTHHQRTPDQTGYRYEALELHRTHKQMQPLLVTFEPLDQGDMVFFSHVGEECVYVIAGEIEFHTPDDSRRLLPGDCLYFDSDLSHSFRSAGTSAAQALVVVCTGAQA